MMLVMAAAPPPAACAYAGVTNIVKPHDSGARAPARNWRATYIGTFVVGKETRKGNSLNLTTTSAGTLDAANSTSLDHPGPRLVTGGHCSVGKPAASFGSSQLAGRRPSLHLRAKGQDLHRYARCAGPCLDGRSLRRLHQWQKPRRAGEHPISGRISRRRLSGGTSGSRRPAGQQLGVAQQCRHSVAGFGANQACLTDQNRSPPSACREFRGRFDRQNQLTEYTPCRITQPAPLILLDCAASEGTSGAPLLRRNGRGWAVAGVATATAIGVSAIAAPYDASLFR